MVKKVENKRLGLTGLEAAVIGMSLRFPGARNVEEFWENLKNGVESIAFFKEDELKEAGISPDTFQAPNYVKAGAVVEDKDKFDAAFFDYIPGEAEVMDPQMRWFHECTWEALENAGYDPGNYNGLIGVYAGASRGIGREVQAMFSETGRTMGQFELSQLTDKDFLSTRTSYKLNLKGPSVSIQTACSTSLVAIHMAYRALITGECDMAVAGGVSLNSSGNLGYLYREGMVRSPDGHCRTFDARAKGTVGGEGIGIVILKRLKNALADGDTVHAVVKGSAINNDGIRKMGYTAPGVEGQYEVIKKAHHMTRFEPGSITYVETHGTGTIIGDPIEIKALTLAFDTGKRKCCALGSVKTNIGHLDAAAGAAGFIKTVLALKHKMIPPGLNFESPNPEIDFENSPFYVNTRLKSWESNGDPLRAGVSSFGIGGTNAHVVLEEAPRDSGSVDRYVGESASEDKKYRLYLLSAKNPSALNKMIENLSAYLKKDHHHPAQTLADAAYTLQVGRKAFKHRAVFVASAPGEAAGILNTSQNMQFYELKEEMQNVVFMFPGQGSQYVDMGLGLFHREPLFREEMDRCFEIYKKVMGYDLKEILYPVSAPSVSSAAENRLAGGSGKVSRTEFAQPLLFFIEYALAKLLMKWGIRPRAMIGHSIGEYAAACLSGVFSLEEAVKAVSLRGQTMQALPGGAMLGIPLAEEELKPLLKSKGDISLAAVNSPSHCVVSGTTEAVDAFEKELIQKGHRCRRLHTSHAFHSPMMDPIMDKFENEMARLTPNEPGIPYVSNVTGNWITKREAANPRYWCRHLRQTVRFFDGIVTVLKESTSPVIFVEIGPGKVLSTFVRHHTGRENNRHHTVNLLRHPQEDTPDDKYLLAKIGQLWLYGVIPDWQAFYPGEKRRRIPLPIYPFQRRVFRVENVEGDIEKIAAGLVSQGDQKEKKPDIADWFYVPVWEQSMPANPVAAFSHGGRDQSPWLLFMDTCGLGTALLERLKGQGKDVVVVKAGIAFKKAGNNEFFVNPAGEDDYNRLFAELARLKKIPGDIIHLWGVTGANPKERRFVLEELEASQDTGLYSLLNTARAVGNQGITGNIRLNVVTDGMLEVMDGEGCCPEKATLLGAVKIIPLEYANFQCRSIDILLTAPGSREEEELLDRLAVELESGFNEVAAAYRGNCRWVQRLKTVRLEEPVKPLPILKRQGVYLITGGFGGMGFTLAEYLAQRFGARLVLIGRSAVTAGKEWAGKIKGFETFGAEVMTFSADVSDYARMKEVIREAELRFGPVNGVFHTAGIADYAGVIQKRTRRQTAEILAPKLRGTLVLEKLLKNAELDFFMLFSSLGNMLYRGKFGQVGYNAANEFLDAFAYYNRSINRIFTTAVNWTDWKEVGMSVEAFDKMSGASEWLDVGMFEKLALSPAEGIEAVRRILGNRFTQVAVYTTDLHTRMKELEALPEKLISMGEGVASPGLDRRPDLSTRYAAPGTEREQGLARVWERFFGLEKIGIDDDFFELGGDSLKAMTLLARIRKIAGIDIPLPEFFRTPAIRGMAAYMDKVKTPTGRSYSLEKAEERSYYPLTSAQKRIFFLDRLAKGNVGYNMTTAVLMEGSLDIRRLAGAFRRLVKRHESLRTSFHLVDKEPVQRVHDENYNLQITNYTTQIENKNHLASRSPQSAASFVKDFIRAFDLSRAPLLRVGITKTGEQQHILLIDMHHIISDGVSLGILTKEIPALYSGRELPELRLQYGDYALWESSSWRQQAVDKARGYWRGSFAGEIPVLSLPTDYPRPQVWNFNGDVMSFELEEKETEKLRQMAAEENVTLYMVLLSIYGVLLSTLSGQGDIVVGLPSAGRGHADLENIIGMFVNTLALRSFPAAGKAFAEYLREIKGRTLAAFENREYPFEDLVEELSIPRNTGRNPLFDTVFILQNYEMSGEGIPGLTLKPYEIKTAVSKFDLSLVAVETGKSVRFSMEYSTALFKEETVKRFAGYYKNIVSSITGNPYRKLGEIEILTGEERRQILEDFNCTDRDYPRHKTIHRLFAEEVEKNPDHTALAGPKLTVSLTYKELNRESEQLAHLLKEKGMEPDAIVGIMVERSIEMIIGIMGILKAGCAFLPIDPNYPEERKEYMLADSGVNVLVTEMGVGNRLACSAAMVSSTLTSTCRVGSANLAYIIYTSGSTGRPKGVMVEHQSLVNLCYWHNRYYGITERDNAAQYAACGFDASVWEVFPYLVKGASVHIVADDIKLDIHALNRFYETRDITIGFLPTQVCEQFMALDNGSLRILLTGGDKLHLFEKKGYRLYNNYGPTENTVVTTSLEVDGYMGNIPIGTPIDNSIVYMVGNDLQLRPIGVTGELCIAGHSLARGYLNRPELTMEKFISVSSVAKKMYKTGDLARWLPDGNIEFLGRIDRQVKIRGYRIEIGEIERLLLRYEKVKEVCVTAREDEKKNKYLCAYIVSSVPGEEAEAAELRAFLAGKLPGYMIPSFFVPLDNFPVTSSGKIDIKRLPAPVIASGKDYMPPGDRIEKELVKIWSEILGREGAIGIDDNFFEVGGNSLKLIQLQVKIKETFTGAVEISTAGLFRYTTIRSQAGYLRGGEKALPEVPTRPAAMAKETGIAVIGMAGRFPGAENIRQFWENLKNGMESVTFFREEELETAGIDKQLLDNSNYIKAKGYLEKSFHFDASFFGYTPVEAEVMNPQIRIFHECAWEALEDAGYDPGAFAGLIGLYAGASPGFYWEALSAAAGKINSLGEFAFTQLTKENFISTRVSYKLDLKGPAVFVHTACSTSLVAIDNACQGLLTGKCDMALAGGISVTFPEKAGYLFQEGMIGSPDGHCRPFDAKAMGTLAGNGVGIVVLKPLEKALAERDHIYALIKGTAVNNDGIRKLGYSAPSVEGQAEVIQAAQRTAGIESGDIDYIETHGTATALGDPVEIEALKLAFKSREKALCRIGSVKSNFGHLDAAAGVTGFIKTALALNHKQIPPSLHYRKPNPKIDFAGSPFEVNTQLKEWEKPFHGRPRRAGVSSFGIGGTNVHVILEEAPVGQSVSESVCDDRECQLLLLSAKTQSALDKASGNLADHLKENPGINLADAAYTLQVGRKAFQHRQMLVCPTHDAKGAIRTLDAGEAETAFAKEGKSTVIFMFSGQGSQYVNMGLDLYKTEPLFRDQVNHCFELLEEITGEDMKPVLYPESPLSKSFAGSRGGFSKEPLAAGGKIDQFLYTTPIKFIFEYSLAVLLMSWGIRPDAMIGHSFGEYAAACLAGVFSLRDGLFLAALRGRLMHGLPPGAMLSVPLSEEELKPILNNKTSLAAINSKSLCVVSGPVEAVRGFEKELNEKGHECLLYHVPKAGHSWMVEPILEEFKTKAARVKFKEPKIPYISGVTGKWITAQQAKDPGYWARHLRAPVRFAHGLTTLLKEPDPLFLQVGPGRGLTLFVDQHPGKKPEHLTLNLVKHRKEEVSDVYYTLTKIGRLWLHGVPIDWEAFHSQEKRYRIPLPAYPFEGMCYQPAKDGFTLSNNFNINATGLSGQSAAGKKSDIADWFYTLSWDRSLLPDTEQAEYRNYLVFLDSQGLGDRLAKQLKQEGCEVTTVQKGTNFSRLKDDPSSYAVHPGKSCDYTALFEDLRGQGRLPRHKKLKLIHLWGIDRANQEKSETEILESYLYSGFYSLLYLAKAVGKLEAGGAAGIEVDIDLVTASVHEITGEEQLCPAKSAVLGPAKVIPQEYPNIRCRNIDIQLPGTDDSKETLIRQLLREFSAEPPDTPDKIIAYRNRFRWVQSVKPMPLPKTGKEVLPVKEGGVYLITGGLGNIGLILGRHLAVSVGAKLILTGRSAFPARQEWEQWLSDHPLDDRISFKIKKLLEIEALGGGVLVLQADVSDYQRMQEVFRQTEETFGTIDGVIHSAGVVGRQTYRTVKEITDAECQRQFQPKVYGLLVLETLLRNRSLDFCLLMSSTSSILGGLGFAAYSAANIFMDSFVQFYNGSRSTANPGRWISVNWDGWPAKEQGIRHRDQAASAGTIGTTIAELTMTAEEGTEAFERVLAYRELQQVIQSAGDLHTRIRQWIMLESLGGRDNREEDRDQVSSQPRQERPPLSTPYTAPGSDIERTLAQIWEKMLGYRQIGIRDNFFQLGGDSLKAVIVNSEIHKTLNTKVPLKDFFSAPTIEELARYITNRKKSRFLAVEPVETREYYPLSSAQKRLFFLDRFEDIGTSYNIPVVLRVRGEISKKQCEAAFKQLIQRHETLRTSFHLINDEPVQKVHDEVDFKMEYYDLTEAIHRSSPIPHHCARFVRPFDLEKAPLLRAGLVKTSPQEDEYLFLFDMHHIISDGTSTGLLTDELIQWYAGEEMPPLKIQYKDFSSWQNRLFETGKIKEQEDYWLNLYSYGRDIPVLNLPTDFPRPGVFDFKGDYYRFKLKGEETQQLKQLSKSTDTTLFMVLLAAFNLLLYRYGGRPDIVVGTGIAGRRHADLRDIIGLFVNMLALRNNAGGEKTFIAFLNEVKMTSIKAFENQDMQFEELVDKLELRRDASRNPLFDVAFVNQNYEQAQKKIKGVTFTPYETSESKTSKFDLTLFAWEGAEEVYFNLEYCTAIFKKDTIENLARHFLNLVKGVIEKPGIAVSMLDILSGEERKRLLFDLNDTAVPFPQERTIHELFAEQAARTPDRIAVVMQDARGAGEDCALTYRVLDERAAQLAGYLAVDKKLRPDHRVGILMTQSVERIVAVLGILRAGGAYVPIDPFLPEERIKNIINDAEISVVISQKKEIRRLNRLQWDCKTFHTYLCLDVTHDIHRVEEEEKNELMNEDLWRYVGETAVDEITGGGWLSSFTGEPFTKEEMDEYGDNILKKLEPLVHPKMRVLEVGCASGITMYRIAPKVGFYFGTDLSTVIIEKNRKQVKEEGHRNIRLAALPAHDIDKISEGDFELVIVNSVIQCFHGHNYLRGVIDKIIRLMPPKGYLFIGDVMNRDQRDVLIRDLYDFKHANSGRNYKTKTDFSQELFVSPGFFKDLAVDIPAVQKVEISDKIHTVENELTRFRYDVLLQIDKKQNRETAVKKQPKLKYQHGAGVLSPVGKDAVKTRAASGNLAYVIYTSGTTGKPKGVMIQHRSLVNLCSWHHRYYEVTAEDRATQYAGFGFDASVWEIFPYLIKGAALYLISESMKLDIDALNDYYEKNRITIAFLPTQLCEQFMFMESKRGTLRKLLTGGDKLRVFKKRSYDLYNNYGPTENTVVTTAYPVVLPGDNIPIGMPVDNTRIYILSIDGLQLQPEGAPGELCIAGDSLARGYLQDPELTREKFIMNPHIPGERIYRTGDLVRRRSDGNIEFLGRIDYQVKIRGFRIELGEIETLLMKRSGIKDVCVIHREDTTGSKFLCAYIVPVGGAEFDDTDAETEELSRYLSRSLPDYMIPSHFIDIEALPLTASGKVDKKALPLPLSGETNAKGRGFAEPVSETAITLAAIWSEILGIEKRNISIDADFFELGGHSLKATLLVSKIHKELGVKVPLADVFLTPTIGGLTSYIFNAGNDAADYKRIAPAPAGKAYYPQSSAQKRLFFLEQLEDIGTSYNIPLFLKIEGDLEKERLENIFKLLIRRHETLRTSFHLLDNEPVQKIHDDVEFEIEYYHFATGDTEEGRQKAFVRPFALSHAPLLRVGLERLSRHEHVLLFDMHHIISDGTSMEILIDDFVRIYRGEELPKLKLQYKDFAWWQNHLFETGKIKKQEEFWLTLYEDIARGEIPEAVLPADYPRPEKQDFKGAVFEFELEAEETAAFKEMAAENGATLFMNLLAAFNVLLHKYSERENIIIGSGIAGRHHTDLQDIVGFFVNSLALRNFPQPHISYEEFLKDVKNNCVRAFENQDFQFEELVRKLNLQRNPSRNPIFDVIFTLQNFQRREIETDEELRFSYYDYESETSQFDMSIDVFDKGDTIIFNVNYAAALFKASTVERIAQHYIEVIRQVIEDREIRLKDIAISHELLNAVALIHEEIESNFGF